MTKVLHLYLKPFKMYNFNDGVEHDTEKGISLKWL